jgi:amino-acid N-acetyltransferase
VLRSGLLLIDPEARMERTTAGGAVLRAAAPSDLPAVLALLEGAGLPGAGVEAWLERFVVAEREGSVVAAAGLELYGADALLRSVVVDPAWRGQGLGSALTAELLGEARAAGIGRVYLLTDTAEGYFPRHGFRRIPREEASEAVRRSREFRELCPVSSIVMVAELAAPG